MIQPCLNYAQAALAQYRARPDYGWFAWILGTVVYLGLAGSRPPECLQWVGG